MEVIEDKSHSYNLWYEPWITLESSTGLQERLSIEQSLLQANRFLSIYDFSPPVIMGIHRLLTAILQAALNPQSPIDIHEIRRSGHFPTDAIIEFGHEFNHRFDLFSSGQPFYQSGDIPLSGGQRPDKSVTSLVFEIPKATEINHFRHSYDEDQVFCPACCARCLSTIPAFASIGGRGFKASINGVPPIYIIPAGKNLFDSLALSLLAPSYLPVNLPSSRDLAWWVHLNEIKRGDEVNEVGYLHSMTFPARRVRLFPETIDCTCTRCGSLSSVGVRKIIFEPGENRPSDSTIWLDPFVAYRLARDEPKPIRPTEGKVLWREYATLFLTQRAGRETFEKTIRPAVIYQLANEGLIADVDGLPVRCISIRAHRTQAKFYEWVDAELQIPEQLLNNEDAYDLVKAAIRLAEDGARTIQGVFKDITRQSSKRRRHLSLASRMETNYWTSLSNQFRIFVLSLSSPESLDSCVSRWADQVFELANEAFQKTIMQIGDDSLSLREQVVGCQRCLESLTKQRNRYIENGGFE